jgi:hypothetical protein
MRYKISMKASNFESKKKLSHCSSPPQKFMELKCRSSSMIKNINNELLKIGGVVNKKVPQCGC